MTQLNIVTDDQEKKQKVDALLKQALDRESGILKAAMEKTLANLAAFETKYSKTSDEFFRQYQAGETDDSADSVDWAGEYQIYLSLREQSNALKELVVCK
jgi:vacuolar-type H+-ATPase subunit H